MANWIVTGSLAVPPEGRAPCPLGAPHAATIAPLRIVAAPATDRRVIAIGNLLWSYATTKPADTQAMCRLWRAGDRVADAHTVEIRGAA